MNEQTNVRTYSLPSLSLRYYSFELAGLDRANSSNMAKLLNEGE